ncbi:hypothetical protein X798_02663, partial [Onchocerca flexuosa]|uniref:Uncharacterized protein n=2 Tax=Onchocerca flexuosa TaxID=387005 RepID=A0A183H3C1_9BILA
MRLRDGEGGMNDSTISQQISDVRWVVPLLFPFLPSSDLFPAPHDQTNCPVTKSNFVVVINDR